jgi:hypothetical protein
LCAVNEQFGERVSSGNSNVIVGASAQSSVTQNSGRGSNLKTDAGTKRNDIDGSISISTISQVKQSLLASDFVWSDEELNGEVTCSETKSTRSLSTDRVVSCASPLKVTT